MVTSTCLTGWNQLVRNSKSRGLWPHHSQKNRWPCAKTRGGAGVGALLVPCLRRSPELQTKTFPPRESSRFEGKVSERSEFGLKMQSEWKWQCLESNLVCFPWLQLIVFHFPQVIHSYIPFMSWWRNGHPDIILCEVISPNPSIHHCVYHSWVLLASNYGGVADVLSGSPKVPLSSIGIITQSNVAKTHIDWLQPEALFRPFSEEMLRTALSLIAIKPKFTNDGEGGGIQISADINAQILYKDTHPFFLLDK